MVKTKALQRAIALILALIFILSSLFSCVIVPPASGSGQGSGSGSSDGSGSDSPGGGSTAEGGGDETESGGNTGGPTAEKDYPPEATPGLIYNPESKLTIILGNGAGNDYASGVYNSLSHHLDSAPSVASPASEKAAHEIVIGETNRSISKTALSMLDEIRDSEKGEIGYAIYSDGSSVGIVFDSDPDKLAEKIAMEYFIETHLKEKSLVLKKGCVERGLIDVQKYWQDYDKEKFDTAWEVLEANIPSDNAGEIVKAFKDMYSIYTSKGDVITWFANLFESDICICDTFECQKTKYCGGAGYYYSNSARDNYGRLVGSTYFKFLPDAESTSQALGFIESSGMASRYGWNYAKAIPSWMKTKIGNFIYSLEESDGYFYHPQWDRDYIISTGRSSRRSRDLSWCTGILSKLGKRPKYDTANGTAGENPITPASHSMPFPLGTSSSVAASRVLAVAAIDTGRLSSVESFKAYLATLNINSSSYPVGNELTAMTSEIEARDKVIGTVADPTPLMDALIEFLNENQFEETGHWHPNNDNAYYGVNGLLKISGIYTRAGVAMPNADAAVRSAIAAIRSDQWVDAPVDIYNPWYAISNVRTNLARFGESDGTELSRRIENDLLSEAPSLIFKSKEKISKFQHEDGSFAYTTWGGKPVSSSTSQGCPTAIPGANEGDVNATVISITGLLGNIYSALGLSSYKVPVFGESDLRRYINVVEENKKKKDEPLEIIPEPLDFNDEAEDLSGKLEFKVVSDRGSIELDTVNRGTTSEGVLSFKTSPGGNDQIDFLVADSGRDSSVFFEADIYFDSVSSGTVYQIFFSDPSATAYMLQLSRTASGDIEIIDRSLNGNNDHKNTLIEAGKIKVGEWMKLRVEYYKGTSETSRAAIYVNDELSAVSDNYYGYTTVNKNEPARLGITKVSFYSLNATEGSVLFDNVTVSEMTDIFGQKIDLSSIPQGKNFIGAKA